MEGYVTLHGSIIPMPCSVSTLWLPLVIHLLGLPMGASIARMHVTMCVFPPVYRMRKVHILSVHFALLTCRSA